jgi:hypothetical protein
MLDKSLLTCYNKVTKNKGDKKMDSNYVIILTNGEKITIEAYSCEVIEDKLIFYYKNKSLAATFFTKNIIGFYEKR